MEINYSLVKSEHIKGVKSHIPVICNICTYQWSPCIDKYINSGTGCPQCTGTLPWNYERFYSIIFTWK